MILNAILKIRAFLNRFLMPRRIGYDLPKNALSAKFGFDRGTPIERYYIEQFFEKNNQHIKGVVLEVESDLYSTRYGGKNIQKLEIVDYLATNKKATYVDDLQLGNKLPSNYFDCVVVTQVFGAIKDLHKVAQVLHRIIKPGGYLLSTSSALSTMINPKKGPYWRITPKGLELLFSPLFGEKNITVSSFGNYQAGLAAWSGVASEELTKNELDVYDAQFPIISTIVAKKL